MLIHELTLPRSKVDGCRGAAGARFSPALHAPVSGDHDDRGRLCGATT